jgi:hypothetical protein
LLLSKSSVGYLANLLAGSSPSDEATSANLLASSQNSS